MIVLLVIVETMLFVMIDGGGVSVIVLGIQLVEVNVVPIGLGVIVV